MRAFVFHLGLLCFFGLAGGGFPPAQAEVPRVCTAAGTYLSPMHPQFRGEAGDRCPICGMEMVPDPVCFPPEEESAEDPHAADVPSGSGGIRITPHFQQALGVRSEPAQTQIFGRTVRAYGRVISQTRREYDVTVRTSGWIVDLPASAEGDFMETGDVLFTLYSPDLMAAQADYLIEEGRRIGKKDTRERRLRLYGMDSRSIALLDSSGEMLAETPFHASLTGVVGDLKVRAGSFVSEGQTLMTLRDYTQIWIMSEVPVRDLAFLKVGDSAQVGTAGAEAFRSGEIDFIAPEVDSATQTGHVRIVLENPHGDLKAGMLLEVLFSPDPRERLAVPAEAVIYGGQGAHVLRVEDPARGIFQPVRVVTGITAQGYTEILEGLESGARVVTSGQFMIDSESSLRGGLSAMEGDQTPATDKEGAHGHHP